MFNVGHYFPMLCCVAACAVGFILSLLMKDCSDSNKTPYKSVGKRNVNIHYSKFIILTVFVYAVFYSLVTNSQQEGKLLIQQQLLLDLSTETTALIIGAVVCTSRIIRVISNIIFARVYGKFQTKVGVSLQILLFSSIGFMLFGSFIPQMIVKILVMAIGYALVLFVRDPFKLYIQDVVFKSTPKEQHQTLLGILEFGTKIFGMGMGLGFSAILVDFSLIMVMLIMFAISITEIILGIMLYRMLGTKKPT